MLPVKISKVANFIVFIFICVFFFLFHSYAYLYSTIYFYPEFVTENTYFPLAPFWSFL